MSYRVGVPWPELRPLFRYINELWNCKCFPDLCLLGLFPNAKELTESAAAYNALRSKARVFELGDPEVTLIAVADGCTPRTAALFAFRTAWGAISIDPRLRKTDWPRIQRLTCIAKKVEDCAPAHFTKLVIAAVHSHAPLGVVCERFTGETRVVVAMPCCVKQARERPLILSTWIRVCGALKTKFLYGLIGSRIPILKILSFCDKDGHKM